MVHWISSMRRKSVHRAVEVLLGGSEGADTRTYQDVSVPSWALAARLPFYQYVPPDNIDSPCAFFRGELHTVSGSTLQSFEEAAQYDEQSLEIAQMSGIREVEANALIDLAHFHTRAGDTKKAVSIFHEVEGIFNRFDFILWLRQRGR